MTRIILFLVLIALAAAGAAWIADQGGEIVLSWSGWRIQTTLPVFMLALGVVIVAAMLAWSAVRAVWRMPERVSRRRRERRLARGRHAITHGLLAIGHGDCTPPGRMPMSRAATPETIRWRCCCTRNPRSSTATAMARGARSAPWPSARTRGCSACAGCSSRPSAPTIPPPPCPSPSKRCSWRRHRPGRRRRCWDFAAPAATGTARFGFSTTTSLRA